MSTELARKHPPYMCARVGKKKELLSLRLRALVLLRDLLRLGLCKQSESRCAYRRHLAFSRLRLARAVFLARWLNGLQPARVRLAAALVSPSLKSSCHGYSQSRMAAIVTIAW